MHLLSNKRSSEVASYLKNRALDEVIEMTQESSACGGSHAENVATIPRSFIISPVLHCQLGEDLDGLENANQIHGFGVAKGFVTWDSL